jgi:hypothetical protein
MNVMSSKVVYNNPDIRYIRGHYDKVLLQMTA